MSIEIQNITKQFGNFTALQPINLTVPTGKLTSLLGPSGCGKTTLLRIIAGLELADTGRILFDGVDVTDTPVQKTPHRLYVSALRPISPYECV